MKQKFREPYKITEEGQYITRTQIKFFLNDYTGGGALAALASPEFTKYYENCVVYNSIYDSMEKDPDCAVLYWDHRKETVAIRVPVEGEFPSVETLPSMLTKIKNPFLT